MKLVYMGTPDFAVPALVALAEAGHRIGYVVTQPDAAADRGKKVKFPAVKTKALELGIDVLQPKQVKENRELLDTLKAYEPDAIIVAAYGQILPEDILELPKYGCINIHGSLLPRFRGAAPIQRAIMEGDQETGITIMFMEKGLDTGDMLAKCSIPIGRQNGAQLHDALSEMGAALLIEVLPKLEAGSLKGEAQNDEEATYAPMISKEDGKLDFSRSPEAIERLIRAFDPWPGTYTFYQEKPFKIWEGEADLRENHAPAGTITGVSDQGIEISAGGRTLIAKVIQVPGKKRVHVKDYLRGNRIENGCVLG